MRVFTAVLIVLTFFSGCSATGNMETVLDNYDIPVSSVVNNITFTLPEGASEAVLGTENGSSLYLCDGYSVSVSAMAGGDLEQTIRDVTGFEKAELTVMATTEEACKRYTCAWTALGEGIEQICKAVILDDGTSHFVVSVMCDYNAAGELNQEMNSILDSVSLHAG